MMFQNTLATLVCLSFILNSCQPAEPLYAEKPDKVANQVVSDLLSRSEYMIYDTPDVYSIHYAEVCAAYGALKFAGITDNDQLIDKLGSRYATVKDSIPNTENHVDTNVYGILPLEFYLQTADSAYLEEGLRLARNQWNDTLPNGLSVQTRYWIDDIFMIAALQVQAYRATANQIYLDRAALTVATYLQKLQQPNGLFHHGPEAPHYWGRGNGWVAAGFAILLAELPASNKHYGVILAGYEKMMATLLQYQSEDGMWNQLIDDPASFKESSCTAMFGYAMVTGVNKGLLSKEEYAPAYIKAWNALTGYLNEDGKLREICVGTGQSLDTSYYLNRPRITGDLHGQAPMLWFACELMQ